MNSVQSSVTSNQLEGKRPLPEGWGWTTVGDVVSFEYGKGLTQDKRDASGKVPVYGSNGIVGYHSAALIDKPCLVIGRKGAAGAVHKSDVPCWPIDTTYFAIPPENVNLSFLYYLFLTLDLASLDRSTAIPGLNRNDAYAVNIPLPPLPEQERIVTRLEELLSNLEAGVAALGRVRAGVKRYKASVLKAACEGKLYGDKGVENGELPEGWRLARLDEITDNFDGKRVPVKASDRENMAGEYPYYGASGIIDHVNDYLFDGDYLLIAEDGANLLSRSTPIAFQAHGKFWVNNHAHVVKTKDDMPLGYLEIYLNSLDLKFYITGTAQPKLTQANMNKIHLPVPPLEEQRRIVAEVERRLESARAVESAVEAGLKRAAWLRQAVLRSAFEGRLS